jgi:hypothetical protein
MGTGWEVLPIRAIDHMEYAISAVGAGVLRLAVPAVAPASSPRTLSNPPRSTTVEHLRRDFIEELDVVRIGPSPQGAR